ncbi:MAG: peptidylprolyl isomerase [Treponema sp.]|nr:peptidylprolyl isomerase [Treponema sp.]
MKIENDKWVEIHYTLKNDEGQQLDSSVGSEPLGYVHGRGYLISGLEKLLEGHEPGDKFSAHIEPKEGYGEYDERLIVELDRNKFEFDGEITVGMPFQLMTSSGLSIVHVTKVEGDKITVDGNHELAGKSLNFDIEVVEVRDATEEELNPQGCGGGCGGCGGSCGSGCGGCGDGGCGSCGN